MNRIYLMIGILILGASLTSCIDEDRPCKEVVFKLNWGNDKFYCPHKDHRVVKTESNWACVCPGSTLAAPVSSSTPSAPFVGE